MTNFNNSRLERLLKRYSKEDSPAGWDFFVENRPLTRYRMERQIERVLDLIKKKYKNAQGLKLLDVGCGTGRYLSHFLTLGQAVGVDISEPMLEQAKKHTGGKAILIRGDAENLPLGDNTFDVVTCSYLFENLNGPHDNPQKVFQEMHRVTKSGGQIIFTVETWYSLPNLTGCVLAFLKRRRALNFYSVKKIKKLIEAVRPLSIRIYSLSPSTVFLPWARAFPAMVKLVKIIDEQLEKIFPQFGAQLIVEIEK